MYYQFVACTYLGLLTLLSVLTLGGAVGSTVYVGFL